MLCVYGHYKYFYSYSTRIDFIRRQNLTCKVDPRAVSVKDHVVACVTQYARSLIVIGSPSSSAGCVGVPGGELKPIP